ncbi:MAG: hypothetical protein ACREQ5_03775 [Candidatus Dormibacteria bacterium]
MAANSPSELRVPNWLRVLWLRGLYWPAWDVIVRVRRAAKVQKAGFYIVSCDELLSITEKLDEHPDGWDYPCHCATCRSYAND